MDTRESFRDLRLRDTEPKYRKITDNRDNKLGCCIYIEGWINDVRLSTLYLTGDGVNVLTMKANGHEK